jgi:hypothetical protein|tara:strand:+ start:242 stop:346 length:105 start_codon:yes stop_codon:yes gene_type:complete
MTDFNFLGAMIIFVYLTDVIDWAFDKWVDHKNKD